MPPNNMCTTLNYAIVSLSLTLSHTHTFHCPSHFVSEVCTAANYCRYSVRFIFCCGVVVATVATAAANVVMGIEYEI